MRMIMPTIHLKGFLRSFQSFKRQTNALSQVQYVSYIQNNINFEVDLLCLTLKNA